MSEPTDRNATFCDELIDTTDRFEFKPIAQLLLGFAQLPFDAHALHHGID